MSDTEITAVDVVLAQRGLEDEAARRFKWNPDECTYHIQPERQHLYSCQTCRERSGRPNAICYSCSIQCHSDHDILDIGSKRKISCDCGTLQIGGDPCTLRQSEELEPAENTQYNHNFCGRYCLCNAADDGTSDVMLQCLMGITCQEDWFHVQCLLGENAGDGTTESPPSLGEACGEAKIEEVDEEDSGSNEDDDEDAESSTESIHLEGVSSSIPAHFGAFICASCVEQAGMSFLENTPVVIATVSHKPPEIKGFKRTREMPAFFLAPHYSTLFNTEADSDLRIKKLITKYPFLVSGEKTYQPQPDTDAHSSLFEAGEKALRQLPHEQVANGLEVYKKLRDKLNKYLKPFAQQGRVVTKEDVTAFFANYEG